jgi:formylglycine-generating enzyme required for sulfatase activity
LLTKETVTFANLLVPASGSNNNTKPVMSFKPNLWELYDLIGNVWEWCQDDWIDGYYGHPSDLDSGKFMDAR